MNNPLGFNNYFDGKKYNSDYLSEIHDAGFKNIVLWWGDYENINSDDKSNIISDVRNIGLNIDSLHAPFNVANTLWEKKTSTTRCAAFDTYKKCIEDAGKHKIPFVVIHPTRAHHLPAQPHYDDGFTRIQELLDIAERENVTLAFENLVDLGYLDLIFSEFSHSKLRMCYDSGHAFCNNKEINLIHKYAPYIVTTHIHDNNGVSDQHLQPQDGVLPWSLMLKALSEINYDGSLNLECYKKNYTSSYTNNRFINDSYKKFFSLLH